MKTIYLPSNLDLIGLLAQNPPDFKYHLEDFKYLIGTIIRLKSEIKDHTDKEEADFIPLHSKVLQSRIHDYAKCLRYLIQHKIVESDNYFVPMEKSIGYRLASTLMTDGFKEEPLTLTRLTRKRAREYTKERLLRRHYNHLKKWFNSSLRVDGKGAKGRLETLYKQDMLDGDTKAKEKFHLRNLALSKLIRGEFVCSVDETARRFHSNLTNIKSEVRNYITFENQPLCAVDIKNSQPFISMVLFNRMFYASNEASFNLKSISKPLFKAIQPIINEIKDLLPNVYNIIMLVKPHESQASTEFERYCTLVDKGRLYEYLYPLYHDATGAFYDLTDSNQRSKFKKMFFYSLYADNRMLPSDENFQFRKVFRETFPSVYKVFALIKKGDKALLPIILQAVEAELVVNRIARRVASEQPELPIFTIHDSVTTLHYMREYVHDVIKMEFDQAIGLEPTLEYQNWGAPSKF